MRIDEPGRICQSAAHPEKDAKFFVVIYHGDGLWHVHRAGCRDITRTINHEVVNNVDIYHTVPGGASIVDQIIDEEVREMGYTENDVKVHACCKEGK